MFWHSAHCAGGHLKKDLASIVTSKGVYIIDVDIGPAGSTYFRYRYWKCEQI